MSADTSVVIAAHREEDGELAYTAAVVQAVENLNPGEPDSLECAKAWFLRRQRQWFRGRGAFTRAKILAGLLAEETRVNGILEYEGRTMIEIGENRVYRLSKKGKRIDPPADFRGVHHDNCQCCRGFPRNVLPPSMRH